MKLPASFMHIARLLWDISRQEVRYLYFAYFGITDWWFNCRILFRWLLWKTLVLSTDFTSFMIYVYLSLPLTAWSYIVKHVRLSVQYYTFPCMPVISVSFDLLISWSVLSHHNMSLSFFMAVRVIVTCNIYTIMMVQGLWMKILLHLLFWFCI